MNLVFSKSLGVGVESMPVTWLRGEVMYGVLRSGVHSRRDNGKQDETKDILAGNQIEVGLTPRARSNMCIGIGN